MPRVTRLLGVLALSSALVTPGVAQTVRSAAGTNTSAIQPAVDQFRTDLGSLNPFLPGSVGSGRREINWDAVPAGFSSPNNLPADFFNAPVAGRARGVVFSTPGTGFQVSSNDPLVGVDFGNIHPTYSGTFSPFSPAKLFTPIGSNIMDVTFFIPGTNVPALTRGFGAVFSDVDLGNTTRLVFFDALNRRLGTFFATPSLGSETFSFVGASYGAARIGRVRIVNGNAALAPGVVDQNGNANDLVVMDDFIYGEPVAATVTPEPMSMALLGTGLAGVAAARRRRRKEAE